MGGGAVGGRNFLPPVAERSSRGRQEVPAGGTPIPATGGRGRRLFLAQDEVQRPAAPDVGAGRAQVGEDVGIGAAGVFKSVGEDGQSVEGVVVVDPPRQRNDRR